MQEIERKYLVRSDAFRAEAVRAVEMAQGYLCARRVTARVRIAGDEAFLTFKGKSRDGGLSRFEFERHIPISCARHLLSRCSSVVEKIRYIVPYQGFTFEVDEFLGANRGLIIAEVELSNVAQQPPLPSWILKEVTGHRCYNNSYLAVHPYQDWEGCTVSAKPMAKG